jgi:hypothetical protein
VSISGEAAITSSGGGRAKKRARRDGAADGDAESREAAVAAYAGSVLGECHSLPLAVALAVRAL